MEAIRGLRFSKRPVPATVSADQARADTLKDLDASKPAQLLHSQEALYTRLGLLPPGADLRELTGTISGEQVAGYYDPRTKRLRLVEGAQTGNRVLDEITLAHELTHALEDQRFGLDTNRADQPDDPGEAYTALVEGTATALMLEYLKRYFSGESALGGLLGSAFAEAGTTPLPPFVMDSLTFPYVNGMSFVTNLYNRAGQRWALVDLALSKRPPVSTEQIMHPDKWIAVEVPEKVTLPQPGAGWKQLAAGTLGEFETAELLKLNGAQAADAAAAGWGGDRYELWRRGDGPCETPCIDRDLVVVRWRWDTARDAREFAAALGPVGAKLPHARVTAGPRETTLVLAPDDQLAGSLSH